MASSGEGSRGGKVVGHSRTGKAIYAAGQHAAAAAGLEHNGPHARLPPLREANRAAHIDNAARPSEKLPPLRAGVPPLNRIHIGGSPEMNAKVDSRIASKRAWETTRGMAITDNVSPAAHAKAQEAHELAAKHADNVGKHEEAAEHRSLAQAHQVGASGFGHAAKEATFKHIGQSRIAMAHGALAEQAGAVQDAKDHASGRYAGSGNAKPTNEPKLRLHGNLDRPAVFNKPGYNPR